MLTDTGIDAVGCRAVSRHELQLARDFHQLVLAHKFHTVYNELGTHGAVCPTVVVLAVVFLASCARCYCDDG